MQYTFTFNLSMMFLPSGYPKCLTIWYGLIDFVVHNKVRNAYTSTDNNLIFLKLTFTSIRVLYKSKAFVIMHISVDNY